MSFAFMRCLTLPRLFTSSWNCESPWEKDIEIYLDSIDPEEKEREREEVYVCVCVCVYVHANQSGRSAKLMEFYTIIHLYVKFFWLKMHACSLDLLCVFLGPKGENCLTASWTKRNSLRRKRSWCFTSCSKLSNTCTLTGWLIET